VSEEVDPLAQLAREDSRLLEGMLDGLERRVAALREEVLRRRREGRPADACGGVAPWDAERLLDEWHQLAVWLLALAPYLDPMVSMRVAGRLLKLREWIRRACEEYMGAEEVGQG
jgi:hypothetical protein